MTITAPTPIDVNNLPWIKVDNVSRIDAASNNPDPSSLVFEALQRLASNPSIRNMLQQINDLLANQTNPITGTKGVSLIITTAALNDIGDTTFAYAQAGYIPNDPTYTGGVIYGSEATSNVGGVAARPGDALIYIESRNDYHLYKKPNEGILEYKWTDNEFDGISVDGFRSDFSMSLDRVLFHELAHILTRSTSSTISNTGSAFDYRFPLEAEISRPTSENPNRKTSFNYSEDVAVISENFLYVPYAKDTNRDDDELRLGHGHGRTEGGSSGVDAFEEFTSARTIDRSMPGLSANDRGTPIYYSGYRLGEEGESTLLQMRYYGVGHSVKTGQTDQKYDHYIRYDVVDGTPDIGLYSFSGQTATIDSAVLDVMSDSLIQPSGTLSPYLDLIKPAKQALDVLHSIAPHTNVPGVIGLFQNAHLTDIRPAHINGLDRVVALSAERYADKLGNGEEGDVTGPTKHGTLDVPSIIAIDDSNATTGALVFGGSGYTQRYDQHGSPVDPSHDSFASTADYINGSNESDVIVAGTGTGLIKNLLLGNGGNDILVGRGADDELRGGDGNDILIGGRGRNTIDGGNGFDIVSYADATSWVSVGLDSDTYSKNYGYGGYDGSDDFRYDNLSSIEGIIGSRFNDDLRGSGNSLLIGGEGDDVFYLKRGDVAIGGGGHDTFYLTEGYMFAADNSIIPARYAILDLNNEDIVRPYYGWTMPYYPDSYSVQFDTSQPDQPGRISIALNSTAPGYYPNGAPKTQEIRYEIFVSDLQESDFVNLPYASGPAYVGPSYDFGSLFHLI